MSPNYLSLALTNDQRMVPLLRQTCFVWLKDFWLPYTVLFEKIMYYNNMALFGEDLKPQIDHLVNYGCIMKAI